MKTKLKSKKKLINSKENLEELKLKKPKCQPKNKVLANIFSKFKVKKFSLNKNLMVV